MFQWSTSNNLMLYRSATALWDKSQCFDVLRGIVLSFSICAFLHPDPNCDLRKLTDSSDPLLSEKSFKALLLVLVIQAKNETAGQEITTIREGIWELALEVSLEYQNRIGLGLVLCFCLQRQYCSRIKMVYLLEQFVKQIYWNNNRETEWTVKEVWSVREAECWIQPLKI